MNESDKVRFYEAEIAELSAERDQTIADLESVNGLIESASNLRDEAIRKQGLVEAENPELVDLRTVEGNVGKKSSSSAEGAARKFRSLLVEILAQEPGPWTSREMAQALDEAPDERFRNRTRAAMNRMVESGQLIRVEDGSKYLATEALSVSNAGHMVR